MFCHIPLRFDGIYECVNGLATRHATTIIINSFKHLWLDHEVELNTEHWRNQNRLACAAENLSTLYGIHMSNDDDIHFILLSFSVWFEKSSQHLLNVDQLIWVSMIIQNDISIVDMLNDILNK